MDYQAIRKEVARIVDRLPRQFREQLRNVEFVVEERPSHDLLRAEGLDPRHETLYGIYQGVPLSDRSSLDPEELHEEIRLTVLHEIAHYFGMDEEEIEDLGY
ncbi:MAG: metallopeptidase family protein [Deltaproteobacteria bacterium]|nr:MAG: metallopeptidase family protein [Deltaproteobacteria bacterium]